MMMPKPSKILKNLHENITALHRAGAVDKATMREFDLRCLTPVQEIKPAEIRTLREANNLSQAVFANCLNVGTGLVSKWERGEKKPSGPSLKLLALVKRKGLEAIL